MTMVKATANQMSSTGTVNMGRLGLGGDWTPSLVCRAAYSVHRVAPVQREK
jgi:hypothetical protein